MKKLIIPALIALIILNSGCTTVKVTKVVTGDEQGLRYALGKPFIQVVPNPSGDGTYTAELIYLPDEEQTYAVHASSFLTKYTMELNVDESGILKKVDWTKGGSTLPGEAIGAASEITKAELERRKKVSDEAEAEKKEKLKAGKEAVDKSEEALIQKELELKAAEAELKSLKDTYKGDAITEEIKEKMRATEVLIEKLTAERDSLKTKRDKTVADFNLLSAANDPGSNKAWGPILFEIKDGYDAKKDTGDVSLVAVSWKTGAKQDQFETIGKVVPVTQPEKAPKFTTTGTITATFQNGIATISNSFDKPIISIDPQTSIIKNNVSGKENKLSEANPTLKESKELTIVFDKQKFPAGKYTIDAQFSYKTEEGKKFGSATIELELK